MAQALPVSTSSALPAKVGSGAPLLRVVSPSDLDEQERQQQQAQAQLQKPAPPSDLAAYVRERWTAFRNHRNSGDNSLNERLLRAQRMFEGRYDPTKLAEIRKFGGSEVYSRLVAVKCRGATSLLRDVYLGADRPWSIAPQPDPPIPPTVRASIMQLVSTEVANAQASGQPIEPDQAHMRFVNLMHAAQQAAVRNAMLQAASAGDKMQSMLAQGGFYNALAEFLVDLALSPFAVLKGPVVRMVPKMTWVNGSPSKQIRPQMFWERVDPFNLYFSPGVARITDAEITERRRLTRADLNDLLGLPGYDETAVRAALNDYDNGLRDWLDGPDTEAALNVGRESPTLNQSHMIDAIEYHGNIQGKKLLDQGVDPSLVPDPDRDYAVQTWVVGRHTLKTQLNPSPRQRHPYYVTSFEKVPGTVIGHGLADILEDWQEMANATARAIVNNMGIASGPQVVVNEERLSPSENPDEMYPWKRWRVVDDPLGSQREAITFFQPQSNATELIGVYNFITSTADDISAIPRYATGESLRGGAGRTASGLSMLMGNSSKVLQTVAANIDIDLMSPALEDLYDMIMLTDQSGMLTGDEQIEVNGVNVALQKETERQKQLQFLQITANPLDMSIVGKVGRGKVLRAVSGNMGLPDDIVPDDDTLKQQEKAEQQQQMADAQNNPEVELTNAKIENLRGSTAANLAKAGLLPGVVPAGEIRSLDKLQSSGGSPTGSGYPSPAAKAQGMQARHPTPAQHADHAPPQNNFQQMPNRGAGHYGP